MDIIHSVAIVFSHFTYIQIETKSFILPFTFFTALLENEQRWWSVGEVYGYVALLHLRSNLYLTENERDLFVEGKIFFQS